jgi:small conductance mechanosensitive channel
LRQAHGCLSRCCSVTIGIRFWALTKRSFDTRYRTNAAIFAALQAAELDIPFPQREVRILDKVAST